MPCCAMMQPIRKVISRMIGTARQPTWSSWCTIEVRRNARGRASTRSSATASAPSMLTIGDERARRPRRCSRPIAAIAASQRDCRRGARRRLRLDAAHLVHQRAIVLGEAGHLGVAAARGEAARQPLEQPGAEGVEPLDPAHVDIDALDGPAPHGLGVDLRLKAVRVLGHPGAGAGELELLALGRGFEQGVAHSRKPLILLPCPAAGRVKREGHT